MAAFDESDLGAFASLPENEGKEPFYVTTAIAYMNGNPHIGHAYEFITTDIIARLHRMLGYDTYFLTGADEHGQKVETSAAKMNRSPQDQVDAYVANFETLNKKLKISNDDYIRTTQDRHKDTCRKLWEMCAKSDDIYLNFHEGWYNEREECYVTDMDAEATDFKDPGTGLPYKRVSEETYFFKMSKYADRLVAHIEGNPSFCEPESARNEILARLRAPEGLKDLCISRTTFSWGIRVPDGFDQKHIMYVWFDALTNYLSGIGALDEGGSELGAKFWPAAKHIIGKDIKWFHCVIWPTMLMSAGLPLPQQVFAHGFVNAADGRKMSKSYNNTIDPHAMLAKYPLDTLRYYVTSSATYGTDLNFSEPALVQMHNSELADVLGNLVHRALNLSHKYCGGVVPETTHDPEYPAPFDLSTLKGEILDLSSSCALHLVAFKAMEAVRQTNRFLTEAEPWKMKGDNEARRPAVVRTTLEAIYAFSHFLGPLIPTTARAIFDKLGTRETTLGNLKADFYNLVPGTPLVIGDILFTKMELPGDAGEEGDAAAAGAGAGAAGKGAKKQQAAGGKKGAKAEAADPNQPDFTKLEVRVGLLQKVWHHETADKLFCEEITFGDSGVEPRQVASGLRAHYTLEQMTGKRVLVVCNLKPAKMVGFESAGMVLAAKHEDGRVELVAPPEGASLGEAVTVEGLAVEEGWVPWAPNRINNKKVWQAVAADLKTNSDCQVTWKDQVITTSAGACVVPSAANAPVS